MISRTSLLAAAVLVSVLGPSTSTIAAPSALGVDAQAIDRAAEHIVLAQAGADAGQVSVVPGRLDPRLRLPACDRPLEAFIPADGQIHQQTAIGVRCSGSVQWTIYTSVTVETLAPVLVARYALPNAATLTAADFVQQTRRVPGLASAYLSNAAALTGQRLRRPVSAGEPLSIDALAPAPLVRRGQQVLLLAHASGIEVRMTGIALSDGRADDRIRVENLSSKRIVEGVVRSESVVEAPL